MKYKLIAEEDRIINGVGLVEAGTIFESIRELSDINIEKIEEKKEMKGKTPKAKKLKTNI